MSGPGPSEIEQVTVQLAGLEITLTARRVSGSVTSAVHPASGSTSSGYSVVPAAPERPSGEDFFDPHNISSALEERALQASEPAALADLDLPFLDSLVGNLRGTDSAWTARARLGRAFRAGVAARRRLDGEFCDISSPGIPFRNSYYIVLRGPGNGPGFWTQNYVTYIGRVGDSNRGLHPDSISHAFASQAEAEAFLVGSRQRWPQRV